MGGTIAKSEEPKLIIQGNVRQHRNQCTYKLINNDAKRRHWRKIWNFDYANKIKVDFFSHLSDYS